MSQASVVEADLDIQGDVSGQIIAGNYNVQIQNSAGIVVNVPSPAVRPTYSRRSTPIDLRPRSFPSLLDRESEFITVKAALRNSMPVSIYGTQGIGKTSLVRQLTHLSEVDGFPDGVVYVEAPGQGLEDLLQSLFEAFCESQPEYKPTETEIRITLRGLKALIFLDHSNLGRDETLSLLNALPNSLFVLCSVERSLWGEGQLISLQGLPEKEAFLLFQHELGRSISEDEQAAVKRICELLQGHPLRILQAASLVNEKSKPISELLEELQQDIPEKAILNASLHTLSRDQERVLALLAAAGGNVMPLEHLVSLSQDPNVRKTLQGLIALGLVQAHSPRYSLTGNLAVSLAASWDLSAWEDTLAGHFMNWLEGQLEQTVMEESVDAILHTLRRVGERERWVEVIRLGRALERHLILGKRWQAWADLLNLILNAAKVLSDRKVEAWALHQLGSRAMCLGHADQARELLTQALNIRKAIKDKAGLEVTRHNLNVLLGGSIPPKGGKSGGPHWFIRGAGMMMALTIAGIFVYVGFSLTGQPPKLSFPVPPFSLFSSATPTPSHTPTPTATHTPTPTPTMTLTPTSTSTLTPTKTPRPSKIPTMTPSSTPSTSFVTIKTGSFCRTGPGKVYPDITAVSAGDTVEIVSVNADRTWYYIYWENFNVHCWISSIAFAGQPPVAVSEAPVPAPPNAIPQPPTNNIPNLPTATHTPNPPSKFTGPFLSTNQIGCNQSITIKEVVGDSDGVSQVELRYWVIDQTTNRASYQSSLPMNFVEAGLFSHWEQTFQAPEINEYPTKSYWFRFMFIATDNAGVQTSSPAYVITYQSCFSPA